MQINTRQDALKKLLDNLPNDKIIKKSPVVLCLSEAGEMYAKAVAKELGLAFEFLFSKAIFAPNNKECPVAVVSETEEIVLNKELIDSFEIELDYIYGEAKRNHDEKIIEDAYKYRKGDLMMDLSGKNVLLVDEGADTGMTLMAALKTMVSLDVKNISLAIAIIPKSLEAQLSKMVDEVYFAYRIENYVNARHYFKTYDL